MPTASGASSPAWSPRPSPSPPATPPSSCRRAPPATSCGDRSSGCCSGRTRPALCLPHLGTRVDLLHLLPARLVAPPEWLSPFDREVILARGAAEAARRRARAAVLRSAPGLVAEMLALYDALRRQRRQVARFEEFLTDELAHSDDRGAVRLLAQTVFLADAFRRYEACLEARHVDDEHRLRDRLMAEPAPQPVQQVIVTVTDRLADPAGLWPADFDLLARLPGLEPTRRRGHRGAARRRLARARVRGAAGHRGSAGAAGPSASAPLCLVPSADEWVFTSRDREEELAAFARRLKAERRAGRLAARHARGPGRAPAAALPLSRPRRARAGRYPLRGARHAAAGRRALRGRPRRRAGVAGRAASPARRRSPLLRSPHLRFADDDGVPS